MNKEKFIEWLQEKSNNLLDVITIEELDDPITSAHLRASIITLLEIKKLIDSGKFD